MSSRQPASYFRLRVSRSSNYTNLTCRRMGRAYHCGMSNDAPVLESAIIPSPRFPSRRIQRLAFIAASLGALGGVAVLGFGVMRGPQASAHVDVHISSPESPSGSPVVNVSRVSQSGRIQVALLLDTSSSMNGQSPAERRSSGRQYGVRDLFQRS